VHDIEAVRNALFDELGFYRPPWQLQVWSGAELVYGSTAADATVARPAVPGRVASLAAGEWASWVAMDAESGVTVRIAQPVVIVWAFALSAADQQLAPLLFCLPFLLIPAWFIVRHGLRPVTEMAAQVEMRSDDYLAALPPSPFRELSPMVESVNRLMQRLRLRLAREQEFLADAAHQLKTPMAVIQANAELMSESQEPAVLARARQGLREGVADADHLTQQLLTLARSSAESQGPAPAPWDLAELLRRRLAMAASLALHRDVQIELEAPETCEVRLHLVSSTFLIDNLVDNAAKYSPDGATVRVRLHHGEAGLQLDVIDQGPGIAPEQRARVFERFYRLPGQDQSGSGLGLAIVERAAARDAARVQLLDNPQGRGLWVSVCWPRA
ncbi:MAG: HAMP domain-containing histidine kinase, partial [Rubrivivax sp.]